MAEKCPLCGGALAGYTCESCGYALPQDKELAALYNLDPDDYPQENPVREIIPEHISEEIYPNRENFAVKAYKKTAVNEMHNASQSLSEFLCDDAEIFKEAAVPQKPIVVKVRKRNMLLTNGYKPRAKLRVKRIEQKPTPASEQKVTFRDSMAECGWLFIIAIFSPTLSTLALIAAAIKKRGRISGKFIALLFAAQVLRIIIVQILLNIN